MVRKLTGVLVALGAVYSSVVGALGLGELSLDSYLNEPFKANIELLNIGDLGEDQVRVQLASREDFQRAGVEREFILTSLNFETQLNERGGGILLLSTSQKVQEPYLNFIIEARWPTGRILREYTVLLDPPIFTENTPTLTTQAGAGNMHATPSVPPSIDTSEAEPDTSASYGGREAIEASSGVTHRVRPNETLWAIAAKTRLAGVSTQQTMLSIHKLNPDAFIGGNINQLKSGSVLRLPVNGQLVEENFAAALAEVAKHHKRWQQNLAGELDTENQPAQQIDATSNEPDSALGSGPDQGPMLKIATLEEGQGEGVEALQSEVVANLENLERAQRSNADLQMRLDAMDEQINTLQRLLALKDEQIAALDAAVKGRTDFTLDDRELDAELLNIEATGNEGAVESVVAAESEPSAEPPAIVAVPVEEPIVSSPSLMDQLLANLPYIGALLILISAGIGYLVYRYRGLRSSKNSEGTSNLVDDEFAGVELGDEELIVDHFSNDGAQETESVAGSSRGVANYGSGASLGYAAQVDTGDVLSEADIYIAYGRFPQAVDLLTEALVHDPANIEARLKLVEVDIEIGDTEAFKQDYANLQAIGDEAALARASLLLEGFDGGEELLEDLPECNLTEDELAVAKSGPAAETAHDTTEDQVDSVDVSAASESVDEEMLSIDLAIDETPEVDSTLLDEPLLDSNENISTEVDSIDAAAESDLDLDIDIDDSLLDDIDGNEDELGLELEIGSEAVDLSSQDIDEDGLEFELGESSGISDEDDKLELLTDDDELELFADDDGLDLLADDNDIDGDSDLNFDFDELEIGDITEDDNAELEIEDGGDLEDFDFSDMDIEDDANDLKPADEFELPELDLPDVSDVPGFKDGGSDTRETVQSADNDEVNTKLDLARAYIDMGDDQGARDIIEEVMQEGNDEQLKQANKLLERLD